MTKMRSNCSVIVITGTRKGIGRFLAEHYLQRGHSVIGCSREESDLQIPEYQHFCLDVYDELLVRQMFHEIGRKVRPSRCAH